MEISSGSYCRLCLEAEKCFTCVFEDREGQTIGEIIETLFTIQIRHEDDFSKSICDDCLDVIMSAFMLKAKGIESEKYLSTLDVEPKQETKSKLMIRSVASVNSFTTQHEELIYDAIQDEEMDTKPIVKHEPELRGFRSIPTFEISTALHHDPYMEEVPYNQFEGSAKKVRGPYKKKALVVPLRAPKKNKKAKSVEQVPRKYNKVKYKEGKLFDCSKCYERFETRRLLEIHILKLHNDTTRPNKCNKCHNQFKKATALAKHKKIHEMDATASTLYEDKNQEKIRSCAVCWKQFRRLESLEEHWDLIHNPLKNPFSCAYCTRRTADEKSIMEHITNHSKLSRDGFAVLIIAGSLNVQRSKRDSDGNQYQKEAIFVNTFERERDEFKRRNIKRAVKELKKGMMTKDDELSIGSEEIEGVQGENEDDEDVTLNLLTEHFIEVESPEIPEVKFPTDLIDSKIEIANIFKKSVEVKSEFQPIKKEKEKEVEIICIDDDDDDPLQ